MSYYLYRTISFSASCCSVSPSSNNWTYPLQASPSSYTVTISTHLHIDIIFCSLTSLLKSYGKDTLRPVTIKQLIDANHQTTGESEFFEIDGTEAAQITFVGQIRNISKQTTNITYRLDDGTGTFEVKVWVDAERANDETDAPAQKGLVENAYARCFGKLKMFGKRHMVASVIRPIQDMNEINYHLLEATFVHLYFSRGPLGEKGEGAAGGATDGGQGQHGAGNGLSVTKLPASTSAAARKVYECMLNTPQVNEGLHVQDIASRSGMSPNDVLKAGDELLSISVIYTTVDDSTWALLDI